MGAVSESPLNFIYKTYEKTNTVEVLKFMKFLFRKLRKKHNLYQCIICLDNHSAHKSFKVRDYVKLAGPTLAYLPPYSSTLNPSK